ncbi:MAG TPA: Ig-like domain-containing protein [Chloroflexota bacterium]|nr:Ig-like domain-containing protein [Chloroflexota bacterium]
MSSRSTASLFHRARWRTRLLPLLSVLIALAPVAPPAGVGFAAGTTYYVGASGNDANPGTSPDRAWRTPAKINTVRFLAGDRILFEGGATFSGKLYFDQLDTGTATDPIVVSSYGVGRATISSGPDTALFASNNGGYLITNINFVGSGRTSNTGDGISFYNVLSGVKAEFVHIDNVDVNGFGKWGVAIGGWNGSSGYRDVGITNVASHDNGRGGIISYGQAMYSNENVYVGHSKAYNNSGVPGMATNSGSGIVLGSVNGGIIERSLAWNNGWLCDARECGAGIWAYDSNNVTIQLNESYGNRTGSSVDGDGFDFDQNVSNSFLQYNYAHDNDGAGYLLAHGPNNQNYTGNVVRYNISQNDGRKNRYGGIVLWGRIRNTEIHNNTVYLSPSATGNPRPIVFFNTGVENLDVSGVHVRNNILQTTGGLPVLEVSASQLAGAGDLLFQGNDYYASGGTFGIAWGGSTYGSVAAWRGATGQERAGGVDVGLSLDPQFTGPGGGPTVGDPDQLQTLGAYRLRSGSALVGSGLNLAGLFGVDPGARDYDGTSLLGLASYDVGADESGNGGGAAATPTATPSAPTATPSAPTATPSAPTATPTLVDTTAPTVAITAPVDGAVVTRGKRTMIAISVSDDVGVTKVETYVDGRLKCTDATAPYACEWAVPSKKGMPYTVQAVAYDAAGNKAGHTIRVTSSP